MIRGVVHHIDTGLVQVGDKPPLYTSSEVVAFCLTVVVACMGCCFICQKSFGIKPCLPPECAQLSFGLDSAEKLSLACCPLVRISWRCRQCQYMSHQRNSTYIQGLQAPFSVGRCQAQRHNVLSLCLYFPWSSPSYTQIDVSTFKYFKTSREFYIFCQCLVESRELLL